MDHRVKFARGLVVLAGLLGFVAPASTASFFPVTPKQLPSFTGGDISCPSGSVVCTVNQILGAPPTAISLASFGAQSNSNTAAVTATNKTAITNWLASGSDLYCPSGQAYYVNSIVQVPTTVRTITGGCKFIAGVGFTDGSAVVRGDSTGFLRITGVEADADLTNFPTSLGFFFTSNTNLTLRDVYATAAYGVADNGSSGTLIDHAIVNDYNVIGVSGQNDTESAIKNSIVKTAGNGKSHCFQFSYGSHLTMSGNSATGCGGFGYSVTGTPTAPQTFVVLTGNRASGTRIEAINATDVQGFSITDNELAFDNYSHDFGLSLFGDTVSGNTGTVSLGVVSGNKIAGPCKAGIALAAQVIGVGVGDNTVTNAGACVGRTASFTGSVTSAGILTVTAVASGVIGQLDAVSGTGIPSGDTIAVYGTSGTTGTGGTGTYALATAPSAAVASETTTSSFTDALHANIGILAYGVANNNNIGVNYVNDFYSPAHLTYAQGEVTDSGTPNSNTFMPALGNAGATGNTKLLGTLSSIIGQPAWVAFTPTLSCSSGTLTTASASGTYQKMGTRATVTIHVGITTLGSCATGIFATIPSTIAPAVTGSLKGWDSGVGGMLVGPVGASGTSVSIRTPTNGFPAQSGSSMDLDATYQTAN